MSNIITIIITFLTFANVSASGITGDWSGKLKAGNSELTIVFHITSESGVLKATMDSPDQGAFGLAVDKVTFENDKLVLEAKSLGINYSGDFDKKTKTIKGTFKQGMAKIPLTLSNKKIAKLVRPQDPIHFPYHMENVTFRNKKEGINLAGTLTMPKNIKVKYVAIMISGSGAQNRDEEVFEHRPFLVWSDYLTRNGVAVLRYDDRGVGESEGSIRGATTYNFSEDAEAAFNYIKSRNDLKGVKVGYIGHSEGGMIAPLVASRNRSTDFIVLLAGPGVPIDELLIHQNHDVAKLRGATQSYIDSEAKMTKNILGYLKKHNNFDINKDAEFKSDLKDFILKELANGSPEQQNAPEKMVEQLVNVYSGKWFRYFVNYDPADALEKVKCPVLAVNGELDCQVRSKENLKAIENALRKGGNGKFRAVELKGLNHVLQKATTGCSTEYRKISETVNIEALKLVKDWIIKL